MRKFLDRLVTRITVEYKLWKLRRQDPFVYDEDD